MDWLRQGCARKVKGIDFTGLTPEAIVMYPGEKNKLQIISDDGTKLVDGVACKTAPEEKKSFRTIWVELE